MITMAWWAYVLGRSRGSVVVVQHASLDRSFRVCRNSLGSNEPVAQPLMISFQMAGSDKEQKIASMSSGFQLHCN
jgi:hypothetical protein